MEATTEYGYTYVFEDGSHDWIVPLGTGRDHALGQFRTLEGGDAVRIVFLSRRVTPWAKDDPTT